MTNRSQRAQTLPLVTGCLSVVITLGIGFYALSLLLGGGRELQNAVDAGNLNVTKQASKNVGVSLKPGTEKDNFRGLVDRDTGKINLLSYNRVVGQAMLVAANAQEEGTQLAKQRAADIFQAVQTGQDSLGERLGRELQSKSGPANQYFLDMGGRNSLRMLGSKTRLAYVNDEFECGYLNRYSSNNKTAVANVSFKRSESPALAPFLSDVEDPQRRGYYFVRGYQSLDFPDIGKIQAVTLNPGQGPHLVSSREFSTNKQSPYSQKKGGLPPNAFKSVAQVEISDAGSKVGQLVNQAMSITGGLGATYPPTMPSAYIKVVNLPGIPFSNVNTVADNPLNNELFEGVQIAQNKAFSTDGVLMQRWVDYNNLPEPKPAPQAMNPPLTGEGIFDSVGNNAAESVLKQITDFNRPCRQCTYMEISGPGAQPVCAELYRGFMKAYTSNSTGALSGGQLIAVEKAKADLIAQYFTSWAQDGQPRNVPAPLSGFGAGPAGVIPPTGLRMFDKSKTHICFPAGSPGNPNLSKSQVTDGTLQFSKPSTIRNYLQQIGTDRNGANVEEKVLAALKRRMKQIKDNLSDEEFDAVVDMKETRDRLEVDTTYYIYLDENSQKFTISTQPPAGIDANSEIELDGRPQVFTSEPYELIGTIVNPVHEIGIHYQLFTSWYDPMNLSQPPTLKGEDEVIWTPNSGFKNLLGQLEFRNKGAGSAQFAGPN